jgi:plastocyanin
MRWFVVLAATAALAFAGCGGDDNESSATPAATEAPTEAPTEAATEDASSSGSASKLAIAADPDGAKKFDKTAYEATAGSVEVDFANDSSLPHAVEIEGNGVEEETETVTGQDAPPLTVDLKPGTYEIYCPVGDHRAEGMEATLTVK